MSHRAVHSASGRFSCQCVLPSQKRVAHPACSSSSPQTLDCRCTPANQWCRPKALSVKSNSSWPSHNCPRRACSASTSTYPSISDTAGHSGKPKRRICSRSGYPGSGVLGRNLTASGTSPRSAVRIRYLSRHQGTAGTVRKNRNRRKSQNGCKQTAGAFVSSASKLSAPPMGKSEAKEAYERGRVGWGETGSP